MLYRACIVRCIHRHTCMFDSPCCVCVCCSLSLACSWTSYGKRYVHLLHCTAQIVTLCVSVSRFQHSCCDKTNLCSLHCQLHSKVKVRSLDNGHTVSLHHDTLDTRVSVTTVFLFFSRRGRWGGGDNICFGFHDLKPTCA